MFPSLEMVNGDYYVKSKTKRYMKTMIPHKHDHSVVSQSRLLDGTEDSAHLVIHEADGGIVGSPQFSHLEYMKIGKMSNIFLQKYLVYFVIGIGDIWFCTNVRNSGCFR